MNSVYTKSILDELFSSFVVAYSILFAHFILLVARLFLIVIHYVFLVVTFCSSLVTCFCRALLFARWLLTFFASFSWHFAHCSLLLSFCLLDSFVCWMFRLDFASPSCSKLVIRFKIIDWCVEFSLKNLKNLAVKNETKGFP